MTALKKYLGETDVSHLPEYQKSKEDYAIMYIDLYGGIDGAHHKDWVLDQVARILMDAPVTTKIAKWDDGTENLKYNVGTSERYEQWVNQIESAGYEYYKGIAP